MAAAADALGGACPLLIYTGGWPSSACARLLRAAGVGGAAALHHGDMDLEGLRILDQLRMSAGGSLWRMEVADDRRHCPAGATLGAGHADPALQDASCAGWPRRWWRPAASCRRSRRRWRS